MARRCVDMRDGTGEILALTGLRGMASVLIAIYHVSFLGTHATSRPALFMQHGYLWADLFFVLSGFIMGTAYRPVVINGGWQAYGGFLWRRLARIYPLYMMTTILAFILFHHGLTWWHQPLSDPARVMVVDLTLLQALHLAPTLDPPAWSISTEWIAYLMFPILGWAMMGSRRWVAIVASAVAVVLLVDLAFGFLPVPSWQAGSFDVTGFLSDRPVMRCLSEFSLGLIACRWKILARSTSSTAVGAVIAILMTCRGTDLAIVLLFPLLVMSLLRERDLLSRLLASRPMLWLGRISYAIYLLHMPLGALRLNLTVLAFMQRLMPSASLASLTRLDTGLLYVAILFLSSVCFVLLERPSRQWLLRRTPAAFRLIKATEPLSR